MQLTSSPRRALGLLAVGALGMSTAVLGATGVAQAAPLLPITFTAADSPIHIPSGYCTVDWTVIGAQGGSNKDGDPGDLGGKLATSTTVEADDEFVLVAGGVGGDGTPGVGGTGGMAGAATSLAGADGDVGAGGGGAGSAVLVDGGPLLWAFGGDGADAAADTGGAGAGVGQNYSTEGPLTPEEIAKTSTTGGPGSVTAVAQPCPPGTPVTPTAPTPAPEAEQPGTPTLTWISAGNKSATMQIWQGWLPEGAKSSPAYEYSLDKGPWKKLATSSEFQIEPTITGLVNGTTYSVRVRVTVDGVSSDATAGQSVTPYQPIGAPDDVAVTFGAASTTITWTAPAPVTGVPAVDKYDVGFSGGEYGDHLCTTAATVLTCTVTDTDWYPGARYTFSVTPLDAAGNPGESGRVEAVAPFPATVPTSDGPLTNAGSSTSLEPGQSITISGTGYMAFSTVTVVVYSTPTVLGTAEADGNGAFTFTGRLPEGLEAGSHTLVAAGVDADGNPYHLTQAITVAGAPGLPNTGASVALPALGGLGALALGGGLLFAARRRTAA